MHFAFVEQRIDQFRLSHLTPARWVQHSSSTVRSSNRDELRLWTSYLHFNSSQCNFCFCCDLDPSVGSIWHIHALFYSKYYFLLHIYQYRSSTAAATLFSNSYGHHCVLHGRVLYRTVLHSCSVGCYCTIMGNSEMIPLSHPFELHHHHHRISRHWKIWNTIIPPVYNNVIVSHRSMQRWSDYGWIERYGWGMEG